MPPLGQYDVGNRLFVLNKGDSGSGKTIGALSFATEDRPFYTFDADQRMESVVTYFLKHRPELLKYNHYDTYYRFSHIIDKLDTWVEKGSCPYGGILLTSITTIAKMIFYEQIQDRIDRAEKSDKVKVLKLGDIPVNQIEDYKAENTGISTMMSMLRSRAFKDTHIFVDAHVMTHYQKSIKDKEGQNDDEYKGKPTRRIITAGQAPAAELPIYFNNIWHYYQLWDVQGRPQYICVFRPTMEVKTEFNDFARTSLTGLPDKIDWTNKLLGEEVRKFYPEKASGFK